MVETTRRELAEQQARRASLLAEVSLRLDEAEDLGEGLEATCRILSNRVVAWARIEIGWEDELFEAEAGEPDDDAEHASEIAAPIRFQGMEAGLLCCRPDSKSSRDLVLGLLPSVAQRLGLAAGRDRARLHEWTARQNLQHVVDVVAHDLRNPLGVIQSSRQVLGLPGLEEQHRGRALDSIDRSVRSATRIIEDLLLLQRSRVGRLNLQREEIELSRLLSLAADSCRLLADEQGTRLEQPPPAAAIDTPVLTDEAHALRVLSNLLRNALQVTPPEGTVLLRACELDGRPAIEIEDQGPGLPAELASWLESHRESIATPQGLRSGLGLTIVRDLGRRLGLHLTVVSNEGRGTRVFVSFPTAPKAVP